MHTLKVYKFSSWLQLLQEESSEMPRNYVAKSKLYTEAAIAQATEEVK